MAFYQFKKSQNLPCRIEQAWDFISSPANLKVITPDYMGFDITSEVTDKMYEGMIISYQVSPIPGYRTTWVTEITKVEEKKFFIDEQRIGPYALWHHQHHLHQIEGGVRMDDIISYSPPFGPIGALANHLIIKSKLEEIFDYRKKALVEVFGEFKDGVDAGPQV